MSDQHSSPEHSGRTTVSNLTLSVIGGVGFILLFAIILYIAYLPTRPDPTGAEAAEARKQRLAELQAKDESVLTSYAWVDQQEGKVRIPIERAMELTAERNE